MLDLNFDPANIVWFLLVLVRISTIVFIVPVFGGNFVPLQWKIGFSVIMTVLLSMNMEKPPYDAALMQASGLFVAAAREVALGFIFGLASGFIFYAVMLWGQVIGAQIGLGLANIIDPQVETDISVISQFYYLFAIVVFLSIDGHQMLIRGMVDSFRFFPLGTLSLPLEGMSSFIEASGCIFRIAVQLAASMIVLLLLVSTALGIIARTVPQMNIFIVGFPLTLLVGLFGMVVSIPYVTKALIDLFQRIPADLAMIMGSR